MVGALIAAAALGFVVRDEIARRREIRGVVWMIDAFGKSDDAGNGRPAEVFEFQNGGSSTAHLMTLGLIGFSIWQVADYRLRWQYPPNESRSLLVQSDDADAAWLLLAWRDVRDVRFVYMAWMPLVSQSAHWDRLTANFGKRSFRFWRRWTVGPVGPGGRRMIRLRAGRNNDKRIEKALEIASKAGIGVLSPGMR